MMMMFVLLLPLIVTLLCVNAQTINVTSDSIAAAVGVNIHVSYGGTAYDVNALSPYEPNNLTTILKALGVRWVRDGGINQGQPTQDKQWLEIRNLGIKATIIIRSGLANVSAYLDYFRENYEGLVGMFEGVNEPELNAGLAQAYQVQLQWYKAMRSDPYWQHVPLASPSTGQTSYYTNTTLYPLAVSTSDWLNIHIYTNGNPTELRAPGYIPPFTAVMPNKPIMVSEFGFHGAINNRNWGFSPQYTGGDPNATHYIDGNGVGQPLVPRKDGLSSHAIYIIRSVLEYRRLGAARAIVYELLNLNPECGNVSGTTDIEKYGYIDQEQHFGLVGVWADATGKYRLRPFPAYYAIQRLISWYSDISPKTPPTQFPFSVQNATANVRILPSTRSDGSLDLALWLTNPSCNLSSYHPASGDLFPNGSCCWRDGDPQVENAKYHLAVLGGELYPTPVPVTVEFGVKCADILVHYPTRNDTVYSAGGGNKISIGVPVDPVFIRCATSVQSAFTSLFGRIRIL